VGPRDRAGRAGALQLSLYLALIVPLASALDLAGFGTPPWLPLAYRVSVFLVLYAQSL
jgi:hypothetical protein